MLVTDVDLIVEWMTPRLDGEPFRSAPTGLGYADAAGNLVAAVCYSDWTGTSVTASIVIDVITKGFLHYIFDYPFNQLKVKKILAHVAEDNLKSIAMLEKMGFKQECYIADVYPEGGMFIYSMTIEQCKWLEINHG